MSKSFPNELNALLSLIRDYQTTLKATKQKTPEQLAYFDQLKIAYQGIQVALNQEEINDCRVKRFNILTPASNAQNRYNSFLPKVKIVMQIVTNQEDCVFTDETINITYQKGGEENILIREVIDGNKQATFFLNFKGKENNVASITIGYSYTINISYTHHPSIKLDTSENAKKTKRNFDPRVVREDFQKVITELLPEAKMETIPTASWKKLLDFDSIHQILKNDQPDPLPDLTSLSEEELSALNSKYYLQGTPFSTLLEKLKSSLQTFKALPANYEGSDKNEIFGKEYELALSNAERLILLLTEKVETYILISHKIGREQTLRKIPENIRTLYQKALQVLAQQTPAVAELKKRINSYTSLELGYDAWSVEVETSSNAIKKCIQALEEGLNPLTAAVEVLNKTGNKTGEYKNWKKNGFKKLLKKYELVQYAASKLLKNETLQNKIKALASNDGYLELLDDQSENNFTDAEKALFLKNIPASYKLRHETPLDEEGEKLSPFQDGPQTTDIEQGQVSDCYLLAAMANLANPDTAHLLEEMITEKEEKGKKIYVVTLYQEGIPIQVEVDGKFMTLTAPDEENFKDPKKHLGAKPKQDIWVPIIEKAYAKLMAKGDYKLIENDTPQKAMQVLLGNKVETPSSFLLDEQGHLINEGEGTYIKNPIELASIGLQALQQLLLNAQEKGYKMNLNSPKTYKGAKELNHNHVLNIGNGNYMSFDHVYTITGIEGDMVSVFNPHGKASKVGTFFDKDLHQLMQTLTIVTEQLKTDYKAKSFSNSSKEAMIDLAQKLNTSTFKNNFSDLIKPLKSIYEEGLKEKKGVWNFAKKAYEKKFGSFLETVDKLLVSNIGKGFVSLGSDSKVEIAIEQDIPIKTLKEYFSYISISIIKS